MEDILDFTVPTDEEERRKKLRAGKQKLAAFCKKRTRKKQRHDGEASGGMLDFSESQTSEVSSITDFSDVDQASDIQSLSNEETEDGQDSDEKTPRGSLSPEALGHRLRQANLRVTELEEIMIGKQTALDSMASENQVLQAQLASSDGDDPENNPVTQLRGLLKQRDDAIQELTTDLQTTRESRDSLQNEYTAQAQQLAHQVQTLQTQLQQAGTWLETKMGEQAAMALMEAKNELLALQREINDKDAQLENVQAQWSKQLADNKVANERKDNQIKTLTQQLQQIGQQQNGTAENGNDEQVIALQQSMMQREQVWQDALQKREEQWQELVRQRDNTLQDMAAKYSQTVHELELTRSQQKEVSVATKADAESVVETKGDGDVLRLDYQKLKQDYKVIKEREITLLRELSDLKTDNLTFTSRQLESDDKVQQLMLELQHLQPDQEFHSKARGDDAPIESTDIVTELKVENGDLHKQVEHLQQYSSSLLLKEQEGAASVQKLMGEIEELRETQTSDSVETDVDLQVEIAKLKQELESATSGQAQALAESQTLRQKQKENNEVVKQLMMDIEYMKKSGIAQSHIHSPVIANNSEEEQKKKVEQVQAELDEVHGKNILEMKETIKQQYSFELERLGGELKKANDEKTLLTQQFGALQQRYQSVLASSDTTGELSALQAENKNYREHINLLNGQFQQIVQERNAYYLELQNAQGVVSKLQSSAEQLQSYQKQVEHLDHNLRTVSQERDFLRSKLQSASRSNAQQFQPGSQDDYVPVSDMEMLKFQHCSELQRILEDRKQCLTEISTIVGYNLDLSSDQTSASLDIPNTDDLKLYLSQIMSERTFLHKQADETVVPESTSNLASSVSSSGTCDQIYKDLQCRLQSVMEHHQNAAGVLQPVFVDVCSYVQRAESSRGQHSSSSTDRSYEQICVLQEQIKDIVNSNPALKHDLSSSQEILQSYVQAHQYGANLCDNLGTSDSSTLLSPHGASLIVQKQVKEVLSQVYEHIQEALVSQPQLSECMSTSMALLQAHITKPDAADENATSDSSRSVPAEPTISKTPYTGADASDGEPPMKLRKTENVDLQLQLCHYKSAFEQLQATQQETGVSLKKHFQECFSEKLSEDDLEKAINVVETKFHELKSVITEVPLEETVPSSDFTDNTVPSLPVECDRTAVVAEQPTAIHEGQRLAGASTRPEDITEVEILKAMLEGAQGEIGKLKQQLRAGKQDKTDHDVLLSLPNATQVVESTENQSLEQPHIKSLDVTDSEEQMPDVDYDTSSESDADSVVEVKFGSKSQVPGEEQEVNDLRAEVACLKEELEALRSVTQLLDGHSEEALQLQISPVHTCNLSTAIQRDDRGDIPVSEQTQEGSSKQNVQMALDPPPNTDSSDGKEDSSSTVTSFGDEKSEYKLTSEIKRLTDLLHHSEAQISELQQKVNLSSKTTELSEHLQNVPKEEQFTQEKTDNRSTAVSEDSTDYHQKEVDQTLQEDTDNQFVGTSGQLQEPSQTTSDSVQQTLFTETVSGIGSANLEGQSREVAEEEKDGRVMNVPSDWQLLFETKNTEIGELKSMIEKFKSEQEQLNLEHEILLVDSVAEPLNTAEQSENSQLENQQVCNEDVQDSSLLVIKIKELESVIESQQKELFLRKENNDESPKEESDSTDVVQSLPVIQDSRAVPETSNAVTERGASSLEQTVQELKAALKLREEEITSLKDRQTDSVKLNEEEIKASVENLQKQKAELELEVQELQLSVNSLEHKIASLSEKEQTEEDVIIGNDQALQEDQSKEAQAESPEKEVQDDRASLELKVLELQAVVEKQEQEISVLRRNVAAVHVQDQESMLPAATHEEQQHVAEIIREDQTVESTGETKSGHQDAHQLELGNETVVHKQEIDNLQSSPVVTAEPLAESFAHLLKTLKGELAEKTANYKALQDELSKAQAEHQTAITKIHEEHEKTVKNLQQEQSDAVRNLEKSLRKQHSIDLDNLKELHEQENERIRAKNAEVVDETEKRCKLLFDDMIAKHAEVLESIGQQNQVKTEELENKLKDDYQTKKETHEKQKTTDMDKLEINRKKGLQEWEERHSEHVQRDEAKRAKKKKVPTATLR